MYCFKRRKINIQDSFLLLFIYLYILKQNLQTEEIRTKSQYEKQVKEIKLTVYLKIEFHY